MKYLYQVIATGLFLASLALLFAERSTITALRLKIERMRDEFAEAQRLTSAQESHQIEELDRLRTEAREVHKLRNEVNQLRAGAKEVEQLRMENQQLRAANRQLRAAPQNRGTTPGAATPQEGFYVKENWAFSGYATPEAALQSVVWAMREGDTRAFLGSLTPEEMDRVQKEWGTKSEAEISAHAKRGTDKINSIRILESRTLSDDEVVLNVYAAGGEDQVQKISMKRFGAEWKLAGPKKE